MITEAKFKKALREMMLSSPLRDITVRTLCEYCGSHRQTFYYHYQDIYDLLNSVFLGEQVPGFSEAAEPDANLKAIQAYAKDNFAFLRAAYNSAASELPDDFFFSKVMTSYFGYYSKHPLGTLSKEGARVACRRFARMVADEYSYLFHNQEVTPLRFDRLMNRYLNVAKEKLFPAIVEATAEERKH